MKNKAFKVFCNHEDIKKKLKGFGFEFLEEPEDVNKNETLTVVVQYLDCENQHDFMQVDQVFLKTEKSDVPVIVLDDKLNPQHSKDVWLKKNVVRYLPLDESEATWAEVKKFLSQRMNHRKREIELQKNDTYKVGWSVKIKPEEFKTHNLVSLFMGSMGDFMVDLKLLLDTVRPETLSDNPVKTMDKPQSLEYEWALRNNEEKHHFGGQHIKKADMAQTLKKNGGRALFHADPPDRSIRNHIIIEGESGTGKSLITEFIHDYVYCNLPNEKVGELKKINCANLGEKIMETQLFGAIKGAYTGAVTGSGAILEAYNGTLFLDEIGEVPPEMQARLLSYIETQRIHPTGWSGKGIYVPSLIVAATNRQLKEEVKNGKFRRDLHHRLGFTVTIPPLRKRKGDLDRLVDFVLQNPMINPVKKRSKRAVDSIERTAVELLKQQKFPGNFRQLEQIMRRSVITAQSRGVKTITEDNIKECLGG